jgi:molybdate transport system substrate-binding protein
MAGHSSLVRAASPKVTIAAASDLKFVLEEITQNVLAASGAEVQLVFGASSNLARQIQQGAPFDVFMSADESLVERLHAEGLTADAGVTYAIGKLVLIAGSSGPSLDGDLKQLLAGATKIALANPDHAPYGRAAAAALSALGFADALRPKWVVGDNVMQATQYVLTGAAPLGFSAISLTRASPFATKLRVQTLPQDLYAPLKQRMVLTRRGAGAASAAQTIYRLIQSEPARAIFERYGFVATR